MDDSLRAGYPRSSCEESSLKVTPDARIRWAATSMCRALVPTALSARYGQIGTVTSVVILLGQPPVQEE